MQKEREMGLADSLTFNIPVNWFSFQTRKNVRKR